MNIINIKNKSSLKWKENLLPEKEVENIEILIEYLFNNIDSSFGNYIQNGKTKYQEALWFGPQKYKYGKYKTLNNVSMPYFVKELANNIEKECNFKEGYLNSCYINKYNNGGIGKHHDNDEIFKEDKSWQGGKEIEVVVFSIGANSIINIYNDFNNKIPIETIESKNNFLYIMSKNFQNNFYHEIGKSNGTRYSFTFRHCV
jgi:hypothetical protein